MKKISNDNDFESYIGKYIDVLVNGTLKKYFVSPIDSGSITTNAGILYKPYSIIGESSYQKCEDINDLTWETTFLGTEHGNPWSISNSGRDVSFIIEDSLDCGGTNANVQEGTAVATISVGIYTIYMSFSFEGNVEQQDSGFENMSFFLNNVELGNATSRNLDLGCVMGPPLSNVLVSPPYVLSPDSENEFRITFTTGDGRWHNDAYYRINLGFFYDSALTVPVTAF